MEAVKASPVHLRLLRLFAAKTSRSLSVPCAVFVVESKQRLLPFSAVQGHNLKNMSAIRMKVLVFASLVLFRLCGRAELGSRSAQK